MKGNDITAAQQQLSTALGIDHKALVATDFITRLRLGGGNLPSLNPMPNAWLSRVDEILPGPAASVVALWPCPAQDGDGDPEWAAPCSVCVVTDHEWELGDTDQFDRAEADCQAIAERLAELLAQTPGPIEFVHVIPASGDMNLAEVKVQQLDQEAS